MFIHAEIRICVFFRKLKFVITYLTQKKSEILRLTKIYMLKIAQTHTKNQEEYSDSKI